MIEGTEKKDEERATLRITPELKWEFDELQLKLRHRFGGKKPNHTGIVRLLLDCYQKVQEIESRNKVLELDAQNVKEVTVPSGHPFAKEMALVGKILVAAPERIRKVVVENLARWARQAGVNNHETGTDRGTRKDNTGRP